MLAELIHQLLGTIRPLHALMLKEADKLPPIGCSELVAVLVVCVEALNHDRERSDTDLPKRVVLVEAASQLTTITREETSSLEVIIGRVVDDLAGFFLKKIDLHVAWRGSLVSSEHLG